MKEKILSQITNYFLESNDFNGIPLRLILKNFDLTLEETREIISKLVTKEKTTLCFAKHHQNPHIKRVEDFPIDQQLEYLYSEDVETINAYPTKSIVKLNIALEEYDYVPYQENMLFVEPQIIPKYFELRVLQRYFQDPRYDINFFDYSGRIIIKDKYYIDDKTNPRDKLGIRSFGIGYDISKNRVIAVFNRYLGETTKDHQFHWKSYEIYEECRMNSDYIRNELYGEWAQHYSAFSAFIQEQVEINKLANIIGKPPFFRTAYDGNRPNEFIPLLLPTKRKFFEFIQLFDIMLSDNINKEFFEGDISLEEKIRHKDGLIEKIRLGTLKLLENWLSHHYRDRDGNDVSKEIVGPLKEVRKLRQKPAHKIIDDEYDLSLPNEQIEIMSRVIRTLTKFRLILMGHPLARENYSP